MKSLYRMLALLMIVLLLCSCSVAGSLQEDAESSAVTTQLAEQSQPQSEDADEQTLQETAAPTEVPTELPTEASAETSAEATEPEPTEPETTEPEPTEPETTEPEEPRQTAKDLTEDSVLFHTSQDWLDLEGECVRLSEVSQWAEDGGFFPRTHYYENYFSGIEEVLLLLDYAFSHGYTGFSAMERPYKAYEVEALANLIAEIYPIDNAWFYAFSESLDSPGSEESKEILHLCMFTTSEDTMRYFMEAMEEAKRVVAEIPSGSDDYEIADNLYNYLRRHTVYDSREIGYYDDDWHCLYDALIKGRTVCTGYSEALYYLLNLAGVDCLTVRGCVEDSDYGHAWNMASIYGEYYCFDVTWDVRRMTGEAAYYFALSREAMDMYAREYYDPSPAELPACDRCFLPPESWQQTPEGAFRCYLWFRNNASDLPYVMLNTIGLYTPETTYEYAEDPYYIVLDIPTEALDSILLTYMTPKCCTMEFNKKLFRSEDGKICAYAYYLREHVYRIRSVTRQEDGSYLATVTTEKGKESWFEFQVVEQDGKYLIDRVSHRT